MKILISKKNKPFFKNEIFSCGKAVVFSNRTPLNNKNNQDAALVYNFDKNKIVMAIADGVGGSKNGGRAALIAVKVLEKELSKAKKTKENLTSVILKSFEIANKKILKTASQSSTTFIVMLFENNKVRSFHAGDSECLLINKKSEITYGLVTDSIVGFGVASGFISYDESFFHAQRNVVLNVLGSHDMYVTVGAFKKMDKTDCLILASDGLFDNFKHSEIAKIVNEGSIETTLKNLAQKTLDRMTYAENWMAPHPDDYTFILFSRQKNK